MLDLNKQTLLIFLGVALLLLYVCWSNGMLEGFVPLVSASHHGGFNVYDEAVMKGGHIYKSLNDVSHGECRNACKKRWGSEYRDCNAYNYHPDKRSCDLIEYDGSDGGGIVPQDEDGMSGGYNYNNPYSAHNLYKNP